MQLTVHLPETGLNSFVKKMWMIEEESGINIEVDAFPVGYPFLNVINGAEFLIESPKSPVLKTSSYLSGPAGTPFKLNMNFVKRALTIQLQPFAIPYIFGLPARDIYNRRLCLSEINTELANRLEEEVISDSDSVSVLRRCEYILLDYCSTLESDPRMSFILDLLLDRKGLMRISDLSHEANLTQRRLQQLFHKNWGISPKTYSRIIKMQYHTYQLLNGRDLDTVIPDGYYDQSHFLHDLKKQTGMLPGEYISHVTSPDKKQAYLFSNLYFS